MAARMLWKTALSARLNEAEIVIDEPANTVIDLEGLLRSAPLNRYETRTRQERQQLWHSIIRESKIGFKQQRGGDRISIKIPQTVESPSEGLSFI